MAKFNLSQRFIRALFFPINLRVNNRFLIVSTLSWSLMLSHTAWSSNSNSAICDSAALAASQSTGVPVSVLRAISLTETGRNTDGFFQPWPWTVNMEGKGVWFDTPEAARAYVEQHFQRGARSFDVGCFQLNYKWHGQAFSSIEEMFDPGANAAYAANFLRELFLEKGNWADAAGAYHSRTPKYANRYKKRFERLLANLSSPPEVGSDLLDEIIPKSIDAPIIVRLNRFPLLQGGLTTSASLGSLMPASAGIDFPPLIGGG